MPQAPDSLRSVLDSVFASSAYAWAPEDKTGAAIVRYWRRLLEWLASLQQANPLLFRLLVAGLVVVLLAILGHAMWLLIRTARGAALAASDAAPATPSTRRTAPWYFAAGDRAASEGRYAEALQLAFVGVALTLEGGYDLDALRASAAATVEVLLDGLSAGPPRSNLPA